MVAGIRQEITKRTPGSFTSEFEARHQQGWARLVFNNKLEVDVVFPAPQNSRKIDYSNIVEGHHE
jgi:hypothetical protein